MRLKGRVAVVTGGSRGIGRAVCLALAREGCDIVVAAKTDEAGGKLPGTIHETAQAVEKLGRRALALKVDVREERDIQAMATRTLETFGRIDILINNAGAIHWADVTDTPPGKFDLMHEVNARAAFLCSRAVLPSMIERRWGHIVMMSPPIRFGKLPGKVAYLLSKMGMTFVARGIAAEMAEHNVAANALWPVTLVESQATIHFQMGEPAQWRTAEVVADATTELCCTPPAQCTGQELYDEEILARAGITNLEKYRCVAGSEPEPLSRALIE